MSFQIDTAVTCYLMPGDANEAQQRFLELVNAEGETWIVAFGFTLQGMVDDLIAAHQRGIALHIYLDHSQSTGVMEKPQVQRLVDAGIEVTIGTSSAGSRYICHSKGVATDLAGGPTCWEGSVNFSAGGWLQVNTGMNFVSQAWRDHFVEQFTELRHFAWTTERSLQLMPNPPAGV